MAGMLITTTSMCMCTMGVAPTPFTPTVNPTAPTAGKLQIGIITDIAPGTNIVPFGICNSMTNPAVVAAKAVGAVAPCAPAPAGTWTPGCPKILVCNQPAIDQSCTLACALGGVISFSKPGQTMVMAQ